MFKKVVKKVAKVARQSAKKIVSEETNKAVDQTSDKILETVVASALVIGAAVLIVSVFGRLIPARMNLHVYTH